MPASRQSPKHQQSGAHDQARTGDLVLTKDALYRLSYVGAVTTLAESAWRAPRVTFSPLRSPALATKGAGAGDGTRTRDFQLGRLELYQTELHPPRAVSSLHQQPRTSQPVGPRGNQL